MEYNENAFVLKADLFKVFDTISRAYLEKVLGAFGFPVQLINLIMSCVSGSKFTIKLNGGTRGGFIHPKHGLRQGCPLCPYLFIMSMDVLSRTLCRSLEEGSLRSIVLALGAPPLTHSVYADDLVLFGKADREEARNIEKIMEDFTNLSGLKINRDKSVIWFSRKGAYKKAEVL
jgi:Reverse transcriptase (RNA-dependent DNA polymerase)